MKWITLIGDDKLTLKSIKNMKHTGAIRAYDVETDRCCVEYNNGHIFYDFDTDLSDWQDDLKNLPFKANCCIMMVYTNAQNVRMNFFSLIFRRTSTLTMTMGLFCRSKNI